MANIARDTPIFPGTVIIGGRVVKIILKRQTSKAQPPTEFHLECCAQDGSPQLECFWRYLGLPCQTDVCVFFSVPEKHPFLKLHNWQPFRKMPGILNF